MSAGTVAYLPTAPMLRPRTVLRAVPLLSRDERRWLLEGLASDEVIGTPHGEAIVTTLLAAFASEALGPDEAAAKWADYLGEYRRWQGWTAADPDYRDLPGFYEEDMAAALADLLDGSSTYHGARPA